MTVVVLSLAVIYFTLRITTMVLAPKRILFVSPRLGQIMARRRNGKNIAFYGHMRGLKAEFVNDEGNTYLDYGYVDEKTGKIWPGEERILSLWWKLFGVRFIGLDSIYQYPIEKTIIERTKEGAKATRQRVDANSLHFTDVYDYELVDAETSDGVRGSLFFSVTLQTTDASQSLQFDSWLAKIDKAVLGMARDYALTKTLAELRTAKNELTQELESFVNCMRQLNTGSIGNSSISEKVGQIVIAANLIDVSFRDEVANAVEATKIAEAQGQALVAKATAEANAKMEEARGYTAIETAKTRVMETRASILTGSGGATLVALEQTKEIAAAVKEHKGTLVLGSQTLPTVPVGEEK